jgi:L-fuconolactonase
MNAAGANVKEAAAVPPAMRRCRGVRSIFDSLRSIGTVAMRSTCLDVRSFRLSRRRFLGAAAGGAAACFLGSMLNPRPPLVQGAEDDAAAGDGDVALAIIDTHQHFWDLDRFRLPWIGPAHPLRRNFLLADYWHAAEGTGITRTIYMEVAVDPAQQAAEAEYVLKLAADPANRIAGAVLAGQPAADGFSDSIARLKQNPLVKGIRAPLAGSMQGGAFVLEKAFVAGVGRLGQEGLRFDINVHGPTMLAAAADLAARCPQTRFILDHCGNVNLRGSDDDFARWQQAIAAVAKHEHVMCKVSGFVGSAGRGPVEPRLVQRAVDHVHDCFGPERVMFGGDWPVCTKVMTLPEWVALVLRITRHRSLEERRKLLHDNAATFYGLA